MPRRVRLDQLLVQRELAPSRERARALILAGAVRVDGDRADRAAEPVAEDATLVVEPGPRYASRGGEKLAGALDSFALDVSGGIAIDVGSSTGGFTDVLLQRGAARVIAVDVGYGQLHERLRADPRVTVLERVNARSLTEVPFAPQLVTCDVSFISVRKALPPVLALAAPGWQALVLVKPQFEATRGEAAKGVVRDPEVRRRVVREVAEAALEWGGQAAGIVDSGLPGPKGNREVFLHLVQRERPELPPDLDERIRAAVV